MAEPLRAVTYGSPHGAASTKEATRQIENVGTAPENVALFKKYEADLKKYAMPGLQILFKEEGAKPSPAPAK